MSEGLSQHEQSQVVPDEQLVESPPPPRRLVRSGKEPASAALRHGLENGSADGLLEMLHEGEEPHLESYFDEFGTDPHRRIALCRAYANYLAAQVGVQRRRSRVVKRIRYGNGHDSEEDHQ